MVRTVISIFWSFLLIIGISVYETTHIRQTFRVFEEHLVALYEKTEEKTASYEDGKAVRNYWLHEKRFLHIWIPHTSIESVDYQLNEAMGYLYEGQFEDAIPKIEVLIEMSKRIPSSLSIRLENVF